MCRITRRQLIKSLWALPLAACLPGFCYAEVTPYFLELKAGYARRLKRILAAGGLPYIDIESSCNSTKVDIDAVAQHMDRLNIGLMALSADIGRKPASRGVPERMVSAVRRRIRMM